MCFFFSSSFERNIGGPGACYKVLAELSPGFADSGPPRGVSTGGKQIAPGYTNIHLYFVFAISCRNKYVEVEAPKQLIDINQRPSRGDKGRDPEI